MSIRLELNINHVIQAVAALKQKGFSNVLTKDIWEQWQQSSYKRNQVPPDESMNRAFGKWLREHEVELGIRFLQEKQIKVDGGKTWNALWMIL